MAPVKLSVNGLSANTSYYYRATDSVLASAVGQFNTAAALGSHTGLRFGGANHAAASKRPP
jgi:phosphodiesterase/alkaline phosphatase D-like protein